MNATINGQGTTVPEGTTVAALLTELGVNLQGVAVAVNERVVRRSHFSNHALCEGDDVEIIRAVAGG